MVRAEDALTGLLLFENGPLVERLAARRLAAFDALTPKARRRMEETALAYVQQQGNAAAMSRALGLHAQTARYRLSRLRELLGDTLDDPDGRFELELALRARLRDGAVLSPGSPETQSGQSARPSRRRRPQASVRQWRSLQPVGTGLGATTSGAPARCPLPELDHLASSRTRPEPATAT